MPPPTTRAWKIGFVLALTILATRSAVANDFSEALAAAAKLCGQGEYRAAEGILLAALKEADGFGPRDLRRAIVLNNLGSVYHFLNDYSRAERCLRAAIDIESDLGEERPIRAVLNLAALYLDTGRYGKAERLGLRSLAEDPPARASTPDLARLLFLLEILEHQRHRYVEAQQYGERALIMFETLAPDGDQVIETLNNLCALYAEAGRDNDALARCERALEILRRRPDLDAALRARLLANVGTVQLHVHGPAAAERFYEEAVRVAENAFGPDDPTFGHILLSYASVLESMDRKVIARQYRRRGKAILETVSTADQRKHTIDIDALSRK